MPRVGSIVTGFVVAFALSAIAAEPEATLDVVRYRPPAGWQVTEPQRTAGGPASRIYVSPDAAQDDKAILVMVASPKAGTLDLKSNFDQLVRQMVGTRQVVEQSEAVASKTRQGYASLAQNVTAKDEKGTMAFAQIVAANVNDQLVCFTYLSGTKAGFDKHGEELTAFLKSVSFGGAGVPTLTDALNARNGARTPVSVATGQQSAGVPSAGKKDGVEYADMNALFASRAMSAEQMQAYVKEMAARRKPHVVLGTVLGEDGKPIPNAKIALRVWGTSNAAERVHFDIDVAADGTFEQQIPDGLYKVSAQAWVTFNGKRTPLPLASLDEKPANRDFASVQGIVKDFRVRMYGLKPGEDPNNVFSYFGGTLNFNDASTDLFNCLNTRYPKGTKINVTAVPTGPMIDGAAAKALRYEFDVDRLHLNSIGFGSVPVATYKLTATATTPDGKTTRLKVGTNMAQLGDEAEVTYGGHGFESEMLDVPQIYLGG